MVQSALDDRSTNEPDSTKCSPSAPLHFRYPVITKELRTEGMGHTEGVQRKVRLPCIRSDHRQTSSREGGTTVQAGA